MAKSPRAAGVTFLDYTRECEKFGGKAAGLAMLPASWVPAWFGLEVAYFDSWMKTCSVPDEAVRRVIEWCDSRALGSVMLRTSGQLETIRDRGKYHSRFVPTVSEVMIREAIEAIYGQAKQLDPHDKMGIVVQQYVHSEFWGHVSNELRISPTRNQWQYEVEHPQSLRRGINSKFALRADPAWQLQLNGSPHRALRSVTSWCAENVLPRCHLEWRISGGQLHIVQLDLEWREHESGYDPTAPALTRSAPRYGDGKLSLLKLYDVGAETRWKKLENLSDFDFRAGNAAPRIYELSSDVLALSSKHPEIKRELVEEIGQVTGGELVVRTDVDQSGFPRYNLPRTDTVSDSGAVAWAELTLADLIDRGALPENVVFLVHGFIPAKASAWAYADPDSANVRIDALWGLPDGIQILPVDTYEVVTTKRKIIPTKSTFKPMFLNEGADGRWEYVQVLTSKGRTKVLRSADILEIAERTKGIADSLNQTAQIMWFCQIPADFDLGRNLPWYRSRDQLEEVRRAEDRYEDFVVRNDRDLAGVPDRKVALVYQPDAELIRNEDFLERVVSRAKELDYPVKLLGSILGHVYYRLCQVGVPVILPNAARYNRVRGRRVFGKLVRDLIPQNIAMGGESVREAELDKVDAPWALSGKIFEEIEEFLSAQDQGEKLAELADVLEVVRGLAFACGIDFADVVAAADKKRTKAGGFERRRVLLETELSAAKAEAIASSSVALAELYSPTVADNAFVIPMASAIGTIGRRPIEIAHPGLGLTLKARLERGALQLEFSLKEKPSNEPVALDGAQLSLFDSKT